MVEWSEVFQQFKFQSLCHDLFHCRFLFVFCLWYFKQTVILIIYSFFMFYSMVDKCMTRGRRFQYFFFVMLVSLYTSLAVTSSIIKTSVKFWGTSLNSGYASVHRWNSLRKALLKTIKLNETQDCLKAHRTILSYVNKIYNR